MDREARNYGIAHMQTCVFRMAQNRWRIPPEKCAEIFKRYDIMGFMRRCYGSLHLGGYQSVLEDVETILRNKGFKL